MFARMMLVVVSLTLGSTWVLGNADANPVGKGLLVVTNQKEHTVLVVDPDARRELAKVVVGVNGHEVMVSKDGRFAYVPIYGNSGVGRPGTDGSTIDVVDLQARKLAATIPPKTAVPTARIVAAPAPEAITSGTNPAMNAKDVIITARNLSLAASIAAAMISWPCRRCSIANSMIRIAFLAASAISTTMPICA